MSLFIILIGFSFVSAECIEYGDEGKNYYSQGFVRDPEAGEVDSIYDSCLDNGNLKEYYCLGGAIASEEFTCLGVCSEGACMCSDSDGGKDYYTKGEFSGLWQGKYPVTNTDSCLDALDVSGDNVYSSNYLGEGYCEGGELKTERITCPNGCEDGACIKSNITQTCTDSDGGANKYETGTTKGPNPEDENKIYVRTDHCWESNQDMDFEGKLTEYYCDENGNFVYKDMFCDEGEVCEDGSCVESNITCTDCGGESELGINPCLEDPNNYWDQQTDKCYEGYSKEIIQNLCSDPDGGKNVFEQAHTFGFRSYSSAEDPDKDLRIRTGGKDGCLSENKLREHYCTSEGYIGFYDIECDFGCEEGICKGTKKIVEVDEKPVILPKTDEENQIIYSCGRCELNDKCYPFGYRKSGRYCSDESDFVEYKDSKEPCDNNFECKSNVCVSGECVSEGLIKRILNWFRRVFGRE